MSSAPAPLPLLDSPDEAPRLSLGVLKVQAKEGAVALPLSGVSISAHVAGRVAGTTLVQTFENPYREPLEAVYVFPLPGGAAVTGFELKVAGRTIKGVVKEREEARRGYRKALQEGKRAALLEAERDDVFTVQVGNLPPLERATVTITLCELLPLFEDGASELRLPLVVAPRYMAGEPIDGTGAGDGTASDTDLVPDASRITPPRLAPGLDPGVDLSVEVTLEASGGISDLASSQHATRTSLDGGKVKVVLARSDERLDRDFVLRYRLASEKVATSLLVHRAADGTAYGLLSVLPPVAAGFQGRARDVVFVLDRSGSMSGAKMASAAKACALLLRSLTPRDRYAVLAFDDQLDWMGTPARRWERADEAGIARGERWLRQVEARGGTEIEGALEAALSLTARGEGRTRRLPVVVVLTDGQVGDEAGAFRRVQTSIGDARLFTVGVDTAVNSGFLRRLAALGGGTVSLVEPGVALDEALRGVSREIGAPIVSALSVSAEGHVPGRVTPSDAPDLFPGRAASLLFAAKEAAPVTVRGTRADGSAFEERVAPEAVDLPAIAALWARSRVRDLEDRFRVEPGSHDATRREIVALSVEHAIVTRFTAFLAVDETETIDRSGKRRKVVQPVHVPSLWKEEREEAPDGAYLCASMAFPAAAPMQAPAPTFRASAKRRPGPVAAAGGFSFRQSESADFAERAAEEPPEWTGSSPRALREAAGRFGDALRRAHDSLEKGKLPDPAPLAEARGRLLTELSASPLAGEVPLLQRFLRTDAADLVAALESPRAIIAELLRAVREALDAFAHVERELRDALDGPGSRPYWERTV